MTGTLTYRRPELRRYSLWKQEEMEAQGFYLEDEWDPLPAAALMLFVSETAAASIKTDLLQLCVHQDRNTNSGGFSSFSTTSPVVFGDNEPVHKL